MIIISPFLWPASAPCKLSCRARGESFYTQVADHVGEGTVCRGTLARPTAVCVLDVCAVSVFFSNFPLVSLLISNTHYVKENFQNILVKVWKFEQPFK